MKNSMSKNSLVVFLIFHGVFINLFLFPSLFIYSKYYSVDYLSSAEWIKSVCLNLISWHFVYHSFKNTDKEATILKFELKKLSALVKFNQLLLSILSGKKTRIFLVSSLIWFALIVNFLLPIIASWFFNLPLSIKTLGLLFISFQLITFMIYYLNYNFPQDLLNNEKPLSSPWFLEVLIDGLTKIKIV